MEPSTCGLRGRVPPDESRRRCQGRGFVTETIVLGLELLAPGVLSSGHPVTGSVVNIGLQHPPAHGLVADTYLAGNGR